MSTMPELILTWGGSDYRCRTTMDVIMHIENKVALARLANRCMADATGLEIPKSHVAWVYYCLLQSAGAPITQDDVWSEVKADNIPMDQTIKVIKFVISEVYGVGPENPEDLELSEDDKKKP